MHSRTLLCAFTLACSLVPLTAQEAKTPPKHLLRYAFEQGKPVYLVTTLHMKSADKGSGTHTEFANDAQLFASLTVSELKDGRARIVEKVSRLKVLQKITGHEGIDYDSDVEGSDSGALAPMFYMVGKEVVAELDSRGNGGAVMTPEELMSLKHMAINLERVVHLQFQELPEAPVAVGDTWENETQIAIGGNMLTAKAKNKLLDVTNGKAKIEMQLLINPNDLKTPASPNDLKTPASTKAAVEKATRTMTLDLTAWQAPTVTDDIVITTKGSFDSRLEITTTTMAAEPPRQGQPSKNLPAKEGGK